MVDPALTQSMAEYIVLGTLALHRELPVYRSDQALGLWKPRPLRLSSERAVGILGLGVMGMAALDALKPFGFPLRGWSTSPKRIVGVATFAGRAELDAFLTQVDILVCLLPLTSETHGILDEGLFAKLPCGAALLNAGRGGHLVEADLLAALDEGQVSSAVLDVLVQEPPAANHPLLRHPGVLVTPHIASATHPASAARQVIRGVRAHLSGQPLVHQVDRYRGY